MVAIITILAALLLPVLTRGKDKARRIQCTNNEKQLIVTWILYASDYHEMLVPNGGKSSMGAVPASPALWVMGGNHSDNQTLVNSNYLISSAYALYAPYLRTATIYKCPADRTEWKYSGIIQNELRSYAMNSYVAVTPAMTQDPLTVLPSLFKVYMKMDSLNADFPAKRFIYGDVHPNSICTPGYGVNMLEDRWIHFPSMLHGPGVFTFADGHAEGHKWLDPVTLRGCPVSNPHNNTCPNSQDLKWLRERTTSRL